LIDGFCAEGATICVHLISFVGLHTTPYFKEGPDSPQAKWAFPKPRKKRGRLGMVSEIRANENKSRIV
jgi:hypothetical protein